MARRVRRHRFILVLSIVIGLFLLLSATLSKADIALGTKTDCTSDSDDGGSVVTAKGCDHDNTSTWRSGIGIYPHWLAVNLTAIYILKSVSIVTLSSFTPASFKIQVWVGGSWVDDGSFTGPACFAGTTNITYTLTTPTVTNRYRIYATTGTCSSYMTVAESWPSGTLASPVVSTQAATSVACASATLNGNLTSLGGSTSASVGFHYGINPGLTDGINLTVGTRNSTGAFSKNLNELRQNTVYYFDTWASGTSGYSKGSILNFTTPACPTICGPDPYSNANLWTVGFLIGITVILGGMGLAVRIPYLLVLAGVAVLFISFYSFCMGGLVPAVLIVFFGLFMMVRTIGQLIDAREEKP